MPLLILNLELGDAGKAKADSAWQFEICQICDNLRDKVLVGGSGFKVCSCGGTVIWDFRVAGSRKRLYFSGWWWSCDGGYESCWKQE